MGLRANPTYRQRRFGAEVRKLREKAALSVADAAALMGMKPPHLSNIEAGRTSLMPERLRTLVGVAGESRRTYIEALSDLGQDPGKGWWSEYRSELRPSYLDLAELEAGSVQLRGYEPLVIPGLLQTFDYATAIHRDSHAPSAPEHQLRMVEFRMARQTVLVGERPPQFHAIIHESALRARIGGRAVMRDQLLRLIEVSRLPNVTVQIFPLDIEGRVAFNHSFTLAEPEVPELGTVQAEQFGTSRYDGDAESIARYGKMFTQLSESALPAVDLKAVPEARKAKDSLGLIQHLLYPLLEERHA